MDNNSENNNVTPENVTNIETTTQELPVVSDPTSVEITTEPEPESTGPIQVEEKPVDPNFVDRTTNPGVIGNIGNTPVEDPTAAVNEDLKKVEVNYTPPSKGKTVSLILFFIFLIAFVIFLPNITGMVNKYMAGKQGDVEEIITTGKLVCTLDSNTSNLDKNYKLAFKFTDNQLYKLDYYVTVRGDITLDAKTLDDLAEKCNTLKSVTSSIEGISVSCDYTEGELVERQSFDYESLDAEKVNAAYAETGGTHPQYENKQDINEIEKQMNASGYSCNRES